MQHEYVKSIQLTDENACFEYWPCHCKIYLVAQLGLTHFFSTNIFSFAKKKYKKYHPAFLEKINEQSFFELVENLKVMVLQSSAAYSKHNNFSSSCGFL